MSSNTVGYEKIQLVAGYNMVGVQFTEVGGSVKPLSTFGAFDASVAGYDDDYKFSTKMLVWDTTDSSYTTYGWSGTSGTDIDGEPEYDNEWLTLGADHMSDSLTAPAGAGVWINAAAASTYTISGEVPTNATTKIRLPAGFNIIANPYPGTVKVADFCDLDASVAGYDDDYKFSTKMLVWDTTDSSYTTYGWSGTSGTDIDGEPEYDNEWLTLGADHAGADKTISFGTAVWLNLATPAEVTFTFPAQ